MALVGIVAVFTVACWTCLLRSKATGFFTVAAATAMMLLLCAGSLYWGRFLCDALLLACMPNDALRMEISPSARSLPSLGDFSLIEPSSCRGRERNMPAWLPRACRRR